MIMCHTTYDPEIGYMHECHCQRAERFEEDLQDIRDHFEMILGIIYDKSKCNKIHLEKHLDVISNILNIKINSKDEIAI